MGFCDDDCFEPLVGMILSKIFGNTLGKALGVLSPWDAGIIGACGS